MRRDSPEQLASREALEPRYAVLAPEYYGTNRFFTGIDKRTGKPVQIEWQGVQWFLLGYAKDMQDAKRLHPCPVLHLEMPKGKERPKMRDLTDV